MALPARAAEEQSQKTQTLDPVVVTAGRIEEKAKNVTQFVTVIPQEELQKNQYQDMSGLLRNYGIQTDSYGPNQNLTTIAMRGVRTSLMGTTDLQGGVLVLVDGRRIGTSNISMIPMMNIERVEIMRGPAAVQYGTAAMGGVINVITKRGTEQLSASAQGGMGNWNTYQAQGNIAWAYGPFDFSGGISHMGTGDYDTGGYNRHRYYNTGLDGKTAYSVNAGVSFLEEHRIGVTVLGVSAWHMGTPGAYDLGVPGFKNRYDRNYTDRHNYSADFLYEGGYKDFGLSWKGRYFFGKNDYTNYGAITPGWFGASDPFFHATNDTQGAQGQLTFKKSFLTLTGGADWLRYDYAEKGPEFGMAGGRMITATNKYDNYGLFLLAKIALFDDRLILSGGVRHDEYRLRADNSSKNLNKTTPTVGVAFHATDWLTLKGNYGESYRIPTATELLGFRDGQWGPRVPNPDLKPEEGRGYDVGFEINHKSLQIGLNYFDTEYKNKIAGWSPAVNLKGRVYLRGFEGKAGYDLGEAFNWPVKVRPYVNFTAFTERSSSKRDATFGHRVPYVSDLELAYGLNFAYPDIGFEADLRLTYMGRQDVENFNTGRAEHIGGKTKVDLFLRQKIYSSDKAGTFSVYGEIRNITNERYALWKDYPMPGRSFFVGLRYDYN